MPWKRCSRGFRKAINSSLEHVESLRKYHAEIIDELWHEPKRLPAVDALFGELEKVATETVYKPGDAELWYDTIVAYGELVSTTIISEYLNYAGVSNRWIDMRRCFLTEQRHKDAGVNIEASASLLKNALGKCVENIFIGQGFIGGAPDGTTTTLGREGSGLLGGRGGQHSRRRVDVGVEGCGRRDERRSESIPRCRADRRAELPRHHRTGLQRRADHPSEDDRRFRTRIFRFTCGPSATSANPAR